MLLYWEIVYMYSRLQLGRCEIGGGMSLVEVTIDSIRVSLMTQHRLVILKDVSLERYLTIWIGVCEADSITWELQEHSSPRPLTHDLINNVIRDMGGSITSIVINDLKDDIFFARIMVDVAGGRKIEIDSRSSDALAVAVRAKVPIYVEEAVMERAASLPDPEIRDEPEEKETKTASEVPDDKLSVFKDFLDSLDLDDLDDQQDR
jgi:uncharacterized protein